MLVDDRSELMAYLTENNVQALEHYTDNFAEFFGSYKQFPNTENFCKKIITLPNHAWLNDSEIETVAKTVRQFYK